MFEFLDPTVIENFFLSYAYSPMYVYVGVVVFMCLSSLGFPLPEEVILVSAGFIAFMALHPDEYPPPTPDSVGVNYITLAMVCFVAVVASDFIIYCIGKYFGERVLKSAFFSKMLSTKNIDKIDNWYDKYGALVCGLFRFTPGIRFPGHMSCGMMGVKWWKFLAVDGAAALISVPTQVILVALYGKVILEKIRPYKMVFFGIIALVILFYLFKHFFLSKRQSS